jgi:putative transposase
MLSLFGRGGIVPFWRLYYHAIWATKHRVPIIEEPMIAPIVRTIETTACDLDVVVFAVGVMPEHIHVFAQIPPSQPVAKVVGRWKGASSHVVNALRPDGLTHLAWQGGYGVLSVSQSGFDRVVEYVQNQRERHARRELYGALERADDELIGTPRTTIDGPAGR